MKKCVKCGKDVNDHENFCSNCGGSEFKVVESFTPNYEAPTQNEQYNQSNQGAYYSPYSNNEQSYQGENANANEDKKNIDDAKICGIVSLAIILIGLVGFSWIPALIGNNKLKNVVNMRNSSEFDTARLLNKIGMIISIVVICLSVVAFVIQVILMVAGFGIGFGLFNDLAGSIM